MKKLNIGKLTCITTSEYSNDEVYANITIDGKKSIRWPQSGSVSMGEHDSVDLNLSLDFEHSVKVELWEEDGGWDSDDFLGRYIFSANETGEGKIVIYDNDEGDQYTLNYLIPEGKTKSVSLVTAKCMAVSSSIDADLITEICNMSSQIASAASAVLADSPDPNTKSISAALDAGAKVITAVPALAQAIDKAGEYPDQLYITLAESSGKDKRAWPKYEDYHITNKNDMIRFDSSESTFSLASPKDFYFWEYDSGSGDDHLGMLSVETDKDVGVYCDMVSNSNGGSIYLVAYKVFYS